MPKLKIPYYNPIVEQWTDEVQQREEEEREKATISVYVITPKLKGFFSIAEVVYDSFDKDRKTFYCYLEEDDGIKFEEFQIRSLQAIGNMVTRIGGIWVKDLDELAEKLNNEA
jgi:hypothetical protein